MNELRVGVNITGDSRDLVGAVGTAKASLRSLRAENRRFSSDLTQQNRQLHREQQDITRELRQQELAANRRNRAFLAGLAPGGRRATGVAGLLGGITSATVAGGPIAGLGMAGLATLPAAAASIAPLASLLPQLGVGLVSAAEGFGVLKAATEGFSKVINAETPKQLSAALKGLDKNAQAAAYRFREELHPALERLRDLSRKEVLPSLFQLGNAFEQMSKPGGAIFQGVKAAGHGVSQMLDSVYNTLNNSDFQARLTKLLTGAGNLIGSSSKFLPGMMKGFVDLSNIALPFADQLATKFGHFVDKADVWIRSHQPQIKQFFHTGLTVLSGWADLLHQIGGTLWGLGRAAAPLAQALGGEITNFFREISGFVNSSHGQNVLKKFFADALPTLNAFGGLVKDVLVDLGSVGANPRTQEFVRDFLSLLRDGVLPVLNTVAQAIPDIASTMAPAFETLKEFAKDSLQPLVANIMKLVETALPPLVNTIKTVADLLEKPLRQLTQVVDLLTKTLALFQGMGGGGAFQGVAEIAAVVAGLKSLPYLKKKLPGFITGGIYGAEAEAKAASGGSLLSALDPRKLATGIYAAPEAGMGVDAISRAMMMLKAKKAGYLPEIPKQFEAEIRQAAGVAPYSKPIGPRNVPKNLRGYYGRLNYEDLVARGMATPTYKIVEDTYTTGLRADAPLYRNAAGKRGWRPLGAFGPELNFPRTKFVQNGFKLTAPKLASAATALPDIEKMFLDRPDLVKNGLAMHGIESGSLTKNLLKFAKASPAIAKSFGIFDLAVSGFSAIDKAINTKGDFGTKAMAGVSQFANDIYDPIKNGKPLGAGLAGAGYGAVLGSVIPGVGTLAGAIVGGVSGLILNALQPYKGKANQATLTSAGTALNNYDIKGFNKAESNAKTQYNQVIKSNGLDAFKDHASKDLKATIDALEALRQKFISVLGPATFSRIKGMDAKLVAGIVTPFQQAANSAGSVVENMRDAMSGVLRQISKDLGLNTKPGTKAVAAAFAQMAKQMIDSISQGRVGLKQGVDLMVSQLARIKPGTKAFAGAFRGMIASVNDSMASGVTNTAKGLAEIGRLLSGALGTLGVPSNVTKSLQAGLAIAGKYSQKLQGESGAVGGIYGFDATPQSSFGVVKARGGYIDAPGGSLRDRVPIIAAKDEAVLTRHQQQPVETALRSTFGIGLREVFANKRPHYMARGGFVGMVAKANEIASHHYNYEWGGGHGANFAPAHGTGHGSGPGIGYDCSGAVSAVLHAGGLLNAPLTSGGFMNWGAPGPGKVTIYSSPDHVYMTLGGRGFGTSSQFNKGGGADWFPAGPRPGFTVRHAVGVGGSDLIKRVKMGGPDGVMKALGQRAIDKTRTAANHFILKKLASMGSVGGGDIGDGFGNGGIGNKAIMKLWTSAGGPARMAPIMAAIAQAESGGQLNAYNPSGASGLWQILGQLVPGDLFNGAVNARNAVAKWKQQGLVAWTGDRAYEALVAGKHKTGPGQFSGGGYVSHEGDRPWAYEPYTPLTPPASLTTTKKKSGSSSAKKKKKLTAAQKAKAKKHIFKSIPPSLKGKHGKYHPRAKRRTAHPGRVPAILAAWLKAQSYGVKLPATGKISDLIEQMSTKIEVLDNIQGLTDEQYTLTDLAGNEYINAELDAAGNVIGKPESGQGMIDPQTGQFAYGINNRIAEISALLQLHAGMTVGSDGKLTVTKSDSGLLGLMMSERDQKSLGIPILSNAIESDQANLAAMRSMRKTWRTIASSDRDELKDMRSKGVSWQRRAGNAQKKAALLQNWLDSIKIARDKGYTISHPTQVAEDKARKKLKHYNDLASRLQTEQPPPLVGPAPTRKKGESAASFSTRLGTWKHRNAQFQDDYTGTQQNVLDANAAADALTKAIGPVRTKIGSLKGSRHDIIQGLQTETFSQIAGEQVEIKRLVNELSELTGTKIMTPTNSDTTLADVNKQLAEDNAKKFALSQAQFDVFRDFAPLAAARMVGSFARGGIIPQTGMALVHKDERIIPDPDGAWRGNANSRIANNSTAAGNTEIHLHGEMAALMRLVDARIDQRTPQISQKLGRRSRVIAVSPGR